MNELLMEAKEALTRAHDHLMELTSKLPMQYFGLVDPDIVQECGHMIDKIDARLAEPQDGEMDKLRECLRWISYGAGLSMSDAEYRVWAKKRAEDELNGRYMSEVTETAVGEYRDKLDVSELQAGAMELVGKIRDARLVSTKDKSYRRFILTDETATALIESAFASLRKESADIAVKDCEDVCKVCGMLNCGDCRGCAKLRAAIMKDRYCP